MKIEEAANKGSSDIDVVRSFLDDDESGEVYTVAELRRKLRLRPNSLDSSSEEKYRYVVRRHSGNGTAWWGNPLAIKRLKEAVAKNGQT